MKYIVHTFDHGTEILCAKDEDIELFDQPQPILAMGASTKLIIPESFLVKARCPRTDAGSVDMAYTLRVREDAILDTYAEACEAACDRLHQEVADAETKLTAANERLSYYLD